MKDKCKECLWHYHVGDSDDTEESWCLELERPTEDVSEEECKEKFEPTYPFIGGE